MALMEPYGTSCEALRPTTARPTMNLPSPLAERGMRGEVYSCSQRAASLAW
jgi:hypothetical protein